MLRSLPFRLLKSTPKKEKLSTQEKNKKKTPCPVRGSLDVWADYEEGRADRVKNNKDLAVSAHTFHRGEPVKSQSYQCIDNDRQAARRGFRNTLVQTMKKLKVVCDDDSHLIIIKGEKPKGETDYFATSLELMKHLNPLLVINLNCLCYLNWPCDHTQIYL